MKRSGIPPPETFVRHPYLPGLCWRRNATEFPLVFEPLLQCNLFSSKDLRRSVCLGNSLPQGRIRCFRNSYLEKSCTYFPIEKCFRPISSGRTLAAWVRLA